MNDTMKNAMDIIRDVDRLVLKIGSNLIVNEKGQLKKAWLDAMASEVSDLRNKGKSIAIVTSGAIALGRKDLGIDFNCAARHIDLSLKQAAAAVGQPLLMQAYQQSFAKYDLKVAQLLVTNQELKHLDARENTKNLINALFKQGFIPIFNENDATSTDEIRIGDNDNLSAQCASLMRADGLILLSTIDGYYTAPPSTAGAQHIPFITEITPEIENAAGDAENGFSTGGMVTKIQAAKHVTKHGCSMIIADGREQSPLSQIKQGARCTIFYKNSACALG
jgi:glutamate 5-kinase